MSQLTRSRIMLLLFALLVLATCGYRSWENSAARQSAPTAPPVASVAPAQANSDAQSSRATPRPTRTPRPAPQPTRTPRPALQPTRTPQPEPTVAPQQPAPTRAPQQSPPLVSGMRVVAAARLPREAQHTLELIAQGGPFPYRRDGIPFENREGRLPRKPSGYYHEYTVVTPGSDDRGARRVIAGANGERFYTDNHYDSFVQVTEP